MSLPTICPLVGSRKPAGVIVTPMTDSMIVTPMTNHNGQQENYSPAGEGLLVATGEGDGTAAGEGD